jgi:hypothetical protein
MKNRILQRFRNLTAQDGYVKGRLCFQKWHCAHKHSINAEEQVKELTEPVRYIAMQCRLLVHSTRVSGCRLHAAERDSKPTLHILPEPLSLEPLTVQPG